jgi:cellobiose epimerase
MSKFAIFAAVFFVVSISSKICAQPQDHVYLLISGYTKSEKNKGIAVYDFNQQSGVLKFKSVTDKVENPAYLAISKNGHNLYAVSEKNTGGGAVMAYRFNFTNGTLQPINPVAPTGEGPCYISVDDAQTHVFIANYSDGSLNVFPLNKNGSIDSASRQSIQNTGSSINKENQQGPHAHSAILSPDNHYVLTADLGSDRIYSYRFNPAAGSPLSPASKAFITVKPGSGPRHIIFHPNGNYVYVVNELSGTVDVFDYKDGLLLPKQSISMLPEKFSGIVEAADIHISADGKFLYASNREVRNEIVIYAVSDKGTLRFVARQSVLGAVPRNFVIDPSGKFLLVANQKSNEVIVFRRNVSTGLLTYSGQKISFSEPSCLKFVTAENTDKQERHQIAGEIEYSIQSELLNKWYPQAIDTTYGGFITSFSFDFKPVGDQDKFIVTQARHTWSNSKASELYPDANYLAYAKHGFAFLKNVLWDNVYGGFYNLANRQGIIKSEGKETYGNAFGIYALAAYYHASKDSAALSLAQQAFLWLEKHSHDPVYKGYYQNLQRDGTAAGYKDQNSSIHLLEAFTELYGIWPDTLLRRRLEEMLCLIRDTITTSKGCLTLFLEPDWKPVSFRDSTKSVILKNRQLDHVSFGHDIETAYLIIEAAQTLGWENDQKTLMVAKRMTDHALQNGWDKAVGGFYDEGYYFKGQDKISIIRHTKNWWAQAEGLNTLLMMADLFPDDPMQYYEQFKKQWKYIRTFLIDHKNGDWYEGGLDKEPQKKTALKGHIWKGNYHQLRALMNCMQRLRETSDIN